MINYIFKAKHVFTAFFFVTAVGFMSCHSGNSTSTDPNTPKDTAATTVTTPAAPVVIAADDSLSKGIKDATKDYPGVTATADNGEITLTGSVERDRLQNLMISLNSLHPKKINNKLTIK